MPRHPQHNQKQSGRESRSERAQRSVRANSLESRQASRSTRSEARRVMRAAEDRQSRAYLTGRVQAKQTFTPYERGAELMLRLGVISVVGTLLTLHFDQFRIFLASVSKALT